jgi:hypothetical protein
VVICIQMVFVECQMLAIPVAGNDATDCMAPASMGCTPVEASGRADSVLGVLSMSEG